MIVINCVYGPAHVDHIREVLAPSLADASIDEITLNCMPYLAVSEDRIGSFRSGSVHINDVDNATGKNLGFAEAHNILFRHGAPAGFFLIINPDCIATSGCVDTLVRRYELGERVGIVEGRQWPYEHPKEYDPLTLETPWASGAFSLIDSAAFALIGGMEEKYFMYLEDVDLSWAMWESGYSVLYEPNAYIIHFSGGAYYRNDLLEGEKYFSVRNFPLIARKFFGEEGEKKAWEYIESVSHQDLQVIVRADLEYNFTDFPSRIGVKRSPRLKNKIKILGFCRFHEFAQ